MKAIVQELFGPPDVLQLVDTDPPARRRGDGVWGPMSRLVI
jgi:hypothetical protein